MAKRALIVDDSRSARVILSRMLEGYGLHVETCESAEQSLTYLNSERPDVIFMDHLMPGMDGFQAVQAIKTNPATAMIPVIMYTSQEGELYASQARALGAVGVLPKTVKQSDVQRVLYQLRLLPDRRDGREPVLEPIELGALTNTAPNNAAPSRAPASAPTVSQVAPNPPAAQIPAELEAAIRQAITPILKEHHNELRRWITSVLDSLGYREAANASDNTVVQLDAAPPPAAARDDISVPRPWAYALAAGAALSLVALIVLGVLYARAIDVAPAMQLANDAVSTQAPRASDDGDFGTTDRLRDTMLNADPPISLHQIQIESVPYGEVPLAGARVDRLRQLLSALLEQGVSGTINATTYIGDFCLSGNAVEGYAPADEELPARKCDVIGNPFEDNLRSAQRESLAFANLIGSLAQGGGDIKVNVTHAGRKPIAMYPENPPPEKLTAGAWNGVAERNNRVEFAFQPSTSPNAGNSAE